MVNASDLCRSYPRQQNGGATTARATLLGRLWALLAISASCRADAVSIAPEQWHGRIVREDVQA
jgi:hypothetical protein